MGSSPSRYPPVQQNLLRRLWGWLWYGELCTRCWDERVGYKFVYGAHCTTCLVIDEIRKRAERR